MKTSDEQFKTRKKAWNWLQEQGYKVSIGKFYQDCKSGFPAVASDGAVSCYQVLTYGVALNKQVLANPEMLSSHEFDRRKAEADAEIAEIKAARMKREDDRLWLHAEDAWSVVAALTGKLRDSIRHQIYAAQRDVVQTAGGDQDRSQEVFEFVDVLIDKAFNEVAGGNIDVVFDAGDFVS